VSSALPVGFLCTKDSHKVSPNKEPTEIRECLYTKAQTNVRGYGPYQPARPHYRQHFLVRAKRVFFEPTKRDQEARPRSETKKRDQEARPRSETKKRDQEARPRSFVGPTKSSPRSDHQVDQFWRVLRTLGSKHFLVRAKRGRPTK
jgi:tRNA(Met) C34 N-acetyltransferase TmcA